MPWCPPRGLSTKFAFFVSISINSPRITFVWLLTLFLFVYKFRIRNDNNFHEMANGFHSRLRLLFIFLSFMCEFSVSLAPLRQLSRWCCQVVVLCEISCSQGAALAIEVGVVNSCFSNRLEVRKFLTSLLLLLLVFLPLLLSGASFVNRH